MLLCLTYDVSIGFCYTPVILVTTANNLPLLLAWVPNDIITTCIIPRKYIVIFR